MRIVLLTGSTGAFGKFLAKDLLENDDLHLVLLVRAASDNEAYSRVEQIIDKNDHVSVYAANLLEHNFGLEESIYEKLKAEVTHILHSAASTRFNLTIQESRINNVQTTKNILDFARKCKKLKRFGYISTAFVAGKRTGHILEDELLHSEGFSNTYQQSKYEAEQLTKKESTFPIVIFRPPLIISPPDAETVDHKGPKNLLSILISIIASGKISFFPGSPSSTMDLVNAKDAARAIIKLMLKNSLQYHTYHITNGNKTLTIQSLMDEIEKKTGKKLVVEYLTNVEDFLVRISKENEESQRIFNRAKSFLLEPAYSKIFDNSHTLSELQLDVLGEDPKETLQKAFKNI